MSNKTHLVEAQIFDGELWSNCTPKSRISGTLNGCVETLFEIAVRNNPEESHKLLKRLLDIQHLELQNKLDHKTCN
jgi:hypothetical protein